MEIRRASIKLALDRGSRWFLSIPLIPLEVEEQGNNYLDHLQKVLKVLAFQDIAPYSEFEPKSKPEEGSSSSRSDA